MGASDAQPDPLFLTIKSPDTKLFDAYNHCELTTLGAMVSDDLEFYYDQTGLAERLELTTRQRMKGMGDPNFLGLYSTNAGSAMLSPLIIGTPLATRSRSIPPRAYLRPEP
jgi:hypothetical protein